MLRKKFNGQLPVTVEHIQLRTMASETVDLIDWPLPPSFTGQYPLSSTCTCKCALQYKSAVSKNDPETFGTLVHRIVYAATTLGHSTAYAANAPDHRTVYAATTLDHRTAYAATQSVAECIHGQHEI